MSGLSILIEHKQRRGEIVLYVVPRAVECLLKHIPRNSKAGDFIRKKWLPIVLFGIALGVWMFIREIRFTPEDIDRLEKERMENAIKEGRIPRSPDPDHKKRVAKEGRDRCNQLNMTVLSVLFGRYH